MFRKNRCIYRCIIIITILFLMLITHFHLRRRYAYTAYSNRWIITSDSINNLNSSNTKLIFTTTKDYWNFTLNSFLQIKLEADVSTDIITVIQDNAEYLKNNNNLQIPIYEQAKHYGSMSTVGVKIKSSTGETLTLVFSRIWYTKTICHAGCNPDRSYIYVEALTSNYQRKSFNISSKSGRIINFPRILDITKSEVSECCLTPENPRVAIDGNNQIFLSFNMIDTDKQRKIWLYDIITDHQVPVYVRNNQFSTIEKDWTPFIKENKLYFVYSYKPLKILQCSTDKGACEFTSSTQNSYETGGFRGGTQLVKFRDTDYFVGIARTTVSCGDCRRFYRPHLVVLSTTSRKFHLVYVSEPLMLDNVPMFASYFMSQKINSADFCSNVVRIMTPGSIIDWEWPEDKLTFTISINGKRSFIVSVIGVGNVVQKIISSIETEYPRVFLNNNLDLEMTSYGEATALNYCESVLKTNKFIAEKLKANEQYPKENIIKNVIDSPTYPTFRVASNTKGEVLSSWITNDLVNFGLLGRYLIEYESVYGNQPAGTHLMLDAGGNHGTYALYSASLNQSVLVFEVLLDYWILIQESIRINPKLSERMTLYPFGVGDEYRVWKIIPGGGITHLEFIKPETLDAVNKKPSNDLKIIQTYPLDDFVFQKVSVMKIDVEGFEIRALKGANHIIRTFGVGAILIEIAPNRWSQNNITLEEGISVLEQVTLIGNYLSYIIARNDASCPTSKILKLNGMIDTKNLSMINQQDGKYESAPQIFRLTEWTTIIMHMKNNDWSCNFWLESDLKLANKKN